jgi:hypothetical protein
MKEHTINFSKPCAVCEEIITRRHQWMLDKVFTCSQKCQKIRRWNMIPPMDAEQEAKFREMWASDEFTRGAMGVHFGFNDGWVPLYADRLELGPKKMAVWGEDNSKESFGYAPETWPTIHECFQDHPDANRLTRFSGNGRLVTGNPWASVAGSQSSMGDRQI